MYKIDLFKVENGFGYNILQDGNAIITQEFHPDLDGFVIMDEETAMNQAGIIIQRLEA